MNRRQSLGMVVATACLLSLPAIAMAAPDVQRGPPPGPAPGPTLVAPVSPCYVQMRREVTPRILRAGAALTVSVAGSWACDGRSLPPTDLMLVIEDTDALRGARAWSLPQPLFSLKRAVPALIDHAERMGARVGVMRIAGGWKHDLPVEAGAAHFAAIRSLIAGLEHPLEGAPYRQFGFRAARGLMPPGGRPFILFVDAGQPFVDGPARDQLDRCVQVRGTHGLAVLSLFAAERRYVDCPTPGLFFESTSPVGEDLPERIDEIVDAILRQQAPLGLRYEHPLDATAWTFEPEGVAPDPPDEAGPLRIAWEHRVRGDHEGAFAYRYRLRAAPDLAPGEKRLSTAPGAGLLFDYPEDRITHRLRAERVCVYRTGRRDEDCGGFAAAGTATASAGAAGPRTPTATRTGGSPIQASATPTPRSSTATPSPLPSATPTNGPLPTSTPIPATATPTPSSLYLPRTLMQLER